MKFIQAVSKRVKELLKAKGFTQYQLFQASGVPQSTISTILKAEITTVKMSTVLDICIGFGIELTEFFDRDYFSIALLED